MIQPLSWQKEVLVGRGLNKQVSIRLSPMSFSETLSCQDQLLKEAVAKHGEQDNWKNIALCVPGRTNKACRKVFTFSCLLLVLELNIL